MSSTVLAATKATISDHICRQNRRDFSGLGHGFASLAITRLANLTLSTLHRVPFSHGEHHHNSRCGNKVVTAIQVKSAQDQYLCGPRDSRAETQDSEKKERSADTGDKKKLRPHDTDAGAAIED